MRVFAFAFCHVECPLDAHVGIFSFLFFICQFVILLFLCENFVFACNHIFVSFDALVIYLNVYLLFVRTFRFCNFFT